MFKLYVIFLLGCQVLFYSVNFLFGVVLDNEQLICSKLVIANRFYFKPIVILLYFVLIGTVQCAIINILKRIILIPRIPRKLPVYVSIQTSVILTWNITNNMQWRPQLPHQIIPVLSTLQLRFGQWGERTCDATWCQNILAFSSDIRSKLVIFWYIV